MYTDAHGWGKFPVLESNDESDFQLMGPWGIWMIIRYVIFKIVLVIDDWGISCEIAFE